MSLSRLICLSAFFACLLLSLTGCAQYAPVPGGDDTENSTFYKSDEDLKKTVNSLQVGMTEEEVFKILGHDKDSIPKMSREEIVSSLYGGSNADFNGTLRDQELARSFLTSLNGYKLEYKIVKRKHGFSSPIRIRTTEKGYDFTLNVVFQHGALFEKPILSGGPVNKTSSKTLFDYLNPLAIIGGGKAGVI